MEIPLEIGIGKDIRKKLEAQQYYVVGNHSGVKLCHWTKKALKDEGACYKEKFYGIATHRCLQISPSVLWCTERCQFCWRSESYAGGDSMEQVPHDDPLETLLGMIKGQQHLISGYGGNPKVRREHWDEANEPRHVAISLSGEPTLYKHLDEFIGLCHDRGMTTFLVTNGTNPEALAKLENLPTQLYLTIAGASARVHSAITRPFKPKEAWEKMMETVELMPSLDTRKVIRMTLVKEKNMLEPEKYADLFERSGAHFLEGKGYVSVGELRETLGVEYMPSIEEIVEFSHEILDHHPGLQIIDQFGPSTAVLMAKEDYSWRKLII